MKKTFSTFSEYFKAVTIEWIKSCKLSIQKIIFIVVIILFIIAAIVIPNYMTAEKTEAYISEQEGVITENSHDMIMSADNVVIINLNNNVKKSERPFVFFEAVEKIERENKIISITPINNVVSIDSGGASYTQALILLVEPKNEI